MGKSILRGWLPLAAVRGRYGSLDRDSSGHSILVYFSETSHVTVISLDVLYRAHSGLYRDTKSFFKPSHMPLKMAIFIFL